MTRTRKTADHDLEIIERTAAYLGYFRIDKYRLRHRLHAGGWSPELSREVFERGHVAALLPYDPARDEVVLIEQFRIGAHAAGLAPWLTEIVAGVIEDGESAETVARRETQEEAGLAVAELLPVCKYLVSPGGTSETVAVFCGRVDATGAGGIHALDHEGEDIRVSALPFAEVRARLAAGAFDNAMTVIALQWLALNHDEVRRRWA